jgi:hypothetical protein
VEKDHRPARWVKNIVKLAVTELGRN